MDERILVVGLGVTGLAVAHALVARDVEVVAVDDALEKRPPGLGDAVDFVSRPDPATLARLVAECDAVVPTPGLPDAHPVFIRAAEAGVPIRSEFDLAARWDDRPVVAVTGTDGKTTVTTLVVEMLVASGRAATDAGNTDVPLVAAIDDPSHDLFVVEASSFRLGHTQHFAPAVACWLNFAPDHLDVHRSLADYERAKAAVWRDQTPDQVAIGNLDDTVVARHLAEAPGRRVGFGRGGDYRVDGDRIVTPAGPLLAIDELARRFPHDVSNALAAAACALEAGGDEGACADVLRSFTGLPHRLELVAVVDGVAWYDDSKATVPHAVVSAAGAFDEVVLIAGGQNKGLDLGELARADSVVAVVALGAAAPDVAAAFAGRVPVTLVDTMDDAVDAAASIARADQVVLLSPGCASFDAYASYGERGDHFARLVRARTPTEGATP